VQRELQRAKGAWSVGTHAYRAARCA
jgi:hypothetical protein